MNAGALQAHDPRFLAWTGGVFLTFALLIVLAGLVGRRRLEGVWPAYAVQLATTAWILLPAWLGRSWFFAAVTVTAALAAREAALAASRLGPAPFPPVVIAASVVYCVAAIVPDPTWFLAAPLVLAIGLLLAPVLGGALDGAYARASSTLLSSLYPGLCLAFAIRLAGLGNGLGDVAFLYAVLEINDASAFIVGRAFGRRPYAPRLSPKKTVEGAIGGLAGAAAGGSVLWFLLPELTPLLGALAGVALGVFGQAADLAASAIKRQGQVKDFSSVVPTQGGVLDVYDALALALPLWYLALDLAR